MKLLLVAAMNLLPLSASADENCENLSNVQRSHCLTDYGTFIETQMATTYTELNDRLVFLASTFGLPAEVLLDSLGPSQIAFESYRKHQCKFDSVSGLGGNGTGIHELLCRIEMTKSRIGYLRSMSNKLGGL